MFTFFKIYCIQLLKDYLKIIIYNSKYELNMLISTLYILSSPEGVLRYAFLLPVQAIGVPRDV